MKAILRILALIFFASCISPGGAGGIIYNNYTGPYQALADASGSKIGQASVSCFLGLTCVGNAGIAEAARNGGIIRIATVDYRYTSILAIVFTRTTTIVTGE
ncbi:MAG: hypothetical protein HS115_02320 [Spirochaetales bacterium]|nr:hypothetical protein [Spirochaetales bacterium]